MIQDALKKTIAEALVAAGASQQNGALKIVLEHPAEIIHGDYSTSVALAYAKELKMAPRAVAEKVAAHLNAILADKKQKKAAGLESVETIEIAGPGFINIRLSRSFFADEVLHIIKKGGKFGANQSLKGKKIVIDYTNPNPFKVFHIGHLMANAIGEALSRIIEAQGAHVTRLNYQGDVGLHIAKTIWGMLQNEAAFPKEDATLEDMINYMSAAYVAGSAAFDEAEKDPSKKAVKDEIVVINKMLFEKSNPKLMKIYDWGKKVSLLKFETIYQKLGTKFDHYFFESEVAEDGMLIVKDFLKRGVFSESEGAIVFKGEPYGLHTRVFITSAGLPTYEGKEVGVTRVKFDRFNPDLSIVVTGNEQNDYFKVVTKALSLMFPYMEGKMKHIGHGMMRLAVEGGGSKKIGSRKGNAITGESLIDDVSVMVREKMSDRNLEGAEKEQAII
ncbi:MAG: Arginine--tRNA ligase, partial [Candidatus Taylorbacteria bacterium]|nr:Arginine--tRNA ligase [Candidatus Taylorbacteria bacterium]